MLGAVFPRTSGVQPVEHVEILLQADGEHEEHDTILSHKFPQLD
jgi:hypothetical protein